MYSLSVADDASEACSSLSLSLALTIVGCLDRNGFRDSNFLGTHMAISLAAMNS